MRTHRPLIPPGPAVLFGAVMALLLYRSTCDPVQAQPPEQPEIGLWVDGTQSPVGLADGSPFLDELGKTAYRLNRLVVTVFGNGETVFPLRSEVFRWSFRYRTGKDPFGAFLEAAHQRGIPVFAAFEVLEWVRPGAGGKHDVFARRPDLRELPGFDCRGVEVGKFASPFNPKVRELLVALITEFARRYPGVSGIVLDCRLSAGQVLGYSEAARVACVRAKGIDPADIVLGQRDQKMEARAREWYHWRRDVISDLVDTLGKSYRAVNPHGKVIAVGSANFYRQKLGIRNLTCQDWLQWMVEGHIDEVLVQECWSDPHNKNLWAAVKALVNRANRRAPLTPVVSLGEPTALAADLSALKEQGPLSRVILKPPQTRNLPDAIRTALKGLAE